MNKSTFLQIISQWLPVVGLLMLISSIPYGWTVYQKISCIIFGLGYAVYLWTAKPWRGWHWRRENWLYVVMIILWLMIPVRQLFDPTPATDYFHFQWHKHEWFLYVGIMGILGFSDKLTLRQVAWVMLGTSVVMFLHCGWLYYFADEFHDYYSFERWEVLRRTHINSHMVMNLYINGALVVALCAWRTIKNTWEKVALVLAMLIAWSVILFSAGRIGAIGSLVIVGVALIYAMFRRNRYAGLACIVLVVAAGLTVMLLKPRLRPDAFRHEARVAIWDYSMRMAKQRPITGYGFSTLSVQYVEQAYTDPVMYNGFIATVIELNPAFAAQGKTMQTHHPHNAFLLYWLGIGIFGLLAFIALFVVAACLPIGENRVFLWLFLFALFLQCMTEPVGAHVLPQCIALVLFVIEHGHRSALQPL